MTKTSTEVPEVFNRKDIPATAWTRAKDYDAAPNPYNSS